MTSCQKMSRDGVEDHRNQPIFMHFTFRRWEKFKNISCSIDSLYCLPEDYKSEPGFKPDWQEFDIDEDGYFKFEGKKYYYREDARFETENRDRFKGFGGWFFDTIWRVTPRVIADDGTILKTFAPDTAVSPTIPTKIKFWRYKE